MLNVWEISLNLQKKFLKLPISNTYISTLLPLGEFFYVKVINEDAYEMPIPMGIFNDL